MFHKGLSKESVIKAAKELIEDRGRNNFSMRLLAEKMGVKTASLYTHIESMEKLLTEVGLLALKEQNRHQLTAIAGKERDEAVLALAEGYRNYAKEHCEMYRFIMSMPAGSDEALKEAAELVAEPSMRVLRGYHIDEKSRMHWQRVLRGMMHGFISQEDNGWFSHYSVNVEDSYRFAICCVIDGLRMDEAKHHGEQ